MAYDEELAARLREQLADVAVEERRMFGGLAFSLDGNLVLAASGQGGLLARVDPADAAELSARPAVAPMQMGRRAPMRGWLHVSPAAVASDEALHEWVQRSLRYVRTLPPK